MANLAFVFAFKDAGAKRADLKIVKVLYGFHIWPNCISVGL